MSYYERALCNSGKEKLHFNRKKNSGMPGSEKGSNLPQPFWGEGRETGQKTTYLAITISFIKKETFRLNQRLYICQTQSRS